MADENKAVPIVTVKVVNLDGYVPGVITTLNEQVAKRLVEEKKVVILEAEKSEKSDKKSPATNKK